MGPFIPAVNMTVLMPSDFSSPLPSEDVLSARIIGAGYKLRFSIDRRFGLCRCLVGSLSVEHELHDRCFHWVQLASITRLPSFRDADGCRTSADCTSCVPATPEVSCQRPE